MTEELKTAVLNLKPGDILWVSVPDAMDAATAGKVRDLFRNVTDNLVLVMPQGIRPTIIPQQDPAQLDRIESMLRTMVQALADEDSERPEVTLDGAVLGAPRDETLPL